MIKELSDYLKQRPCTRVRPILLGWTDTRFFFFHQTSTQFVFGIRAWWRIHPEATQTIEVLKAFALEVDDTKSPVNLVLVKRYTEEVEVLEHVDAFLRCPQGSTIAMSVTILKL